jgi:DNA-binding CsgD family transcriptional regulator
VRGTDVSGVLGVHMFTLRREQGRLKEVAPAVRMFLQQHSEASGWRPGLALVYCELGMEEEARAEFEKLVSEDAVNLPLDALWTVCMAYLSEICALLGDSSRARPLYRLLLPYSSYNIATGGGVAFFGAASRYLGMLAATMSNWEDAERHFQGAIAMDARTGSRIWLAHSYHEYAKMLLARSQPGDLAKAKPLLNQALDISREVGMGVLEEHVLALRNQADTRAGERLLAHPYPNDLTEREVEVMQLIAQGKSNREIADSLFITTNTVANHVKNILSKTGSANRTEAATYAMRHNLT